MIKVAVLWVVNEYGEVLLAQRAQHKTHDPGLWGAAAVGRLEPGESFDDAVVRETEEEISLHASDYTPHFLFEKDFPHPDGETRKFGIYYTTLPKAKSDQLKIDTHEVAGIAWFSLDTIKDKMKNHPEDLVPSANAIWPDTFRALQEVKALQEL